MTGVFSLTIEASHQVSSDMFKVLRENRIFCPTKHLFKVSTKFKIINLAETNMKSS